MHSARVCVGVAALLAAVSLAGADARGAATTPADLRADLNRVRASLGLTLLRGNRIADPIVRTMAAANRVDRPPPYLEAAVECGGCASAVAADGAVVDPRQLYARRGGRGTIGFHLWRRGWSAEQNLAVFFETAAMALDPRARTFSAAPTPYGMLLVAITAAAQAPFTTPVRWPRERLDPRSQVWVEVLLPPNIRGAARVVERRGNRQVSVAKPLAEEKGFGSARLVAFGLSPKLAYGHQYTVTTRALSVPFATRPPPDAFLRRTWQFVVLTPEEQDVFLGAIRNGPPLLRTIADELDGAVEVIGGGHGCSVADSCERVLDGDRASIGLRSVEPFQVLHEFGHVVWDLALDEPAIYAFAAAFERSPAYAGKCPRPGSCSLLELFADQFAFWALGGKPPELTRRPPQLLSHETFERLLREGYGYRPSPVVGPLPR